MRSVINNIHSLAEEIIISAQPDRTIDKEANKDGHLLCPRCNNKTGEFLIGEVCTLCLDELEFGYPSYPSYPLSEYNKGG
ncbi:hypothetical protein QFZ77_007057 [Paenibacillus sp. V4I3]|uniref:hypothetical protein n=1 Tax=unclassified Paenibacillus TaxID=185978 RepID=UPI00277DF93F|nr:MULTISPECIES: hypothetical protein [unclassified Paenibacillus]MDQ0878398.1 hypothetical protein [Paenibacillus sp. V4I3]MDQ0885748.1 hypothetical protein [Paenibacillus sp. V4I9]